MIGAILAVAAQALHVALMLAAAPLLAGCVAWLRGRLLGHAGPPPLQPFHDLVRLLRKQAVLPDGASWLFRAAPAADFAASLAAIALVPSFSRGMTTAPVADLLAVLGLLAAARAVRGLAEIDAGSSLGAVAASRTLVMANLAEPALMVAVLTLALLGGGTNLGSLAGVPHDTGFGRWVAQAFAVLALVPVAALDLGNIAVSYHSAIGLALRDGAAWLRRLLWMSVLALFLPPFGIAPPDASPIAWLPGLAIWAGKIAVLAIALAVTQTVLPNLKSIRIEQALGAALLAALLGAVVLFASQGFA